MSSGSLAAAERNSSSNKQPAPIASPPPSTEAINPNRWFILLGLITAAIMQVLDTTIINVALPQMAGNLGATNQEIGWVVTGYILSNVIVLPLTAFLTSRFGRKRYLTVSILIFIVASFFCGASHSLGEMVFWRIIQGIGGAALLSTAQATLVQVFPKSEQGIVQPIFMMGLVVAPTLGPALGGWITDNYTWNWCFLINVPIGLISVFLVAAFLDDPPNSVQVRPVDWWGIGLLALGLGTLQYVLEEGEQNDWFNDTTIVRLAVISVFSLVCLIAWQLSKRNKHPVIDFRVLQNHTLTASLSLFITLGFGIYGGTYVFPLMSQTILGFSSLQTGMSLLPGGIATAISIIICGAILNRPKPLLDARWLIAFGTLLSIVSMWQLGHLSPQTGEDDTAIALLIRGFGIGFLFIPINQAAFACLRPHEVQQASGLMNLSRQLGGSFGISIIATYIQSHIQYHRVELIGNYSTGREIFTSRFHMTSYGLMSHGYSLAGSRLGAASLLDHGLMKQAMSMSYNDAFLMMLIFYVVTAPAIILLRQRKDMATAGGPTQKPRT